MLKILLIIIFLLPPVWLIYTIALYWRTQVPYLATPKKHLDIILKNLKINSSAIVYDLGCGQGSFLFAAEKYGARELFGFELSPWHVFLGRLKAKLLKSKVKIYWQDFFLADISRADIIYLFLTKKILAKVWQKIAREGKKGAWVAVLSNIIPGAKIDQVVEIEPDQKSEIKLYCYQVK